MGQFIRFDFPIFSEVNGPKKRIKKLVINEKPSDHGYQPVKWTGPLLAQWIDKEDGLAYQKAQVYN
ncbi:hypothetical protein [Sphingobacterium composti Ten et al. 2007 non Yoo et al. 2007]|uniref:hypothetical protein n=1 Tax=Sphingobacterium composti TaxID=363260 RepID=UPI0013579E99|nr:hypothetical protein [Sphingobacterium composti Ten et al. 2007 non Yoo et al. 2007]